MMWELARDSALPKAPVDRGFEFLAPQEKGMNAFVCETRSCR